MTTPTSTDGRERYRVFSLWTGLTLLGLPIILDQLRFPESAFRALAVPMIGLWILTIIRTIERLKSADISRWWVWLMVLQINIGPALYTPVQSYDSIQFYFSWAGLIIGLIPVALGCIYPDRKRVTEKSSFG